MLTLILKVIELLHNKVYALQHFIRRYPFSRLHYTFFDLLIKLAYTTYLKLESADYFHYDKVTTFLNRYDYYNRRDALINYLFSKILLLYFFLRPYFIKFWVYIGFLCAPWFIYHFLFLLEFILVKYSLVHSLNFSLIWSYVVPFFTFWSPFTCNFNDPIVLFFSAVWEWLIVNYFKGNFFVSHFFNSSTDTWGYETSWGFFPEFLWLWIPSFYDYSSWYTWYPTVSAFGAPIALPLFFFFLDMYFIRDKVVDNYHYQIFLESEYMYIVPEMVDEETEEVIPQTFYDYFDYYMGWALTASCLAGLQMEGLWDFQEFYFADTQIGFVVNNAWDVSADVKAISKLRLDTYRELYDKFSYTILTQIQHQVFSQTYLDVLQIRYGSALGHFFYQTPNVTLSAEPFYFTKDCSQTIQNMGIQLTDSFDKIVQQALDRATSVKPRYSFTIQDSGGGIVDYGTWTAWAVPDFLYYLEDIRPTDNIFYIEDYPWYEQIVYGPYENEYLDDDEDIGMYDDDEEHHYRAITDPFFGPERIATKYRFEESKDPRAMPSFFSFSDSFFDNEVGDSTYQYQSGIQPLSAYANFLYAYKPFRRANLNFFEDLFFGSFSLDYFLILQQYLRPRYDNGNLFFASQFLEDLEELEHQSFQHGWDVYIWDTYGPMDLEDYDLWEESSNYPYEQEIQYENVDFTLMRMFDSEVGLWNLNKKFINNELNYSTNAVNSDFMNFLYKNFEKNWSEDQKALSTMTDWMKKRSMAYKSKWPYKVGYDPKKDKLWKFAPSYQSWAISMMKSSWYWPSFKSIPINGFWFANALNCSKKITTITNPLILPKGYYQYYLACRRIGWRHILLILPTETGLKGVFLLPDKRKLLREFFFNGQQTNHNWFNTYNDLTKFPSSYKNFESFMVADEMAQGDWDVEMEESGYSDGLFWGDDIEHIAFGAPDPLVAFGNHNLSLNYYDDYGQDELEPRWREIQGFNAVRSMFYWIFNKSFIPFEQKNLIPVQIEATVPTSKWWPFLRRFRNKFPVDMHYLDASNVTDPRLEEAFKVVGLNSWIQGILWDVPDQIQVGALHYAWPFAFDKKGLVPVEWFYSRLTRNDFALNYSFFEWWSPTLRFFQMSDFGAPHWNEHQADTSFKTYNPSIRIPAYDLQFVNYKKQNIHVLRGEMSINHFSHSLTAMQQLVVWRMNAYYDHAHMPPFIDLVSKIYVPNWRPVRAGSYTMFNECVDDVGRLHGFYNFFFKAAAVDTYTYDFYLIRYINGYPLNNRMKGFYYSGFNLDFLNFDWFFSWFKRFF